MENVEEIKEIARKIRNERIKEWRAKNKDKVRESNKRYWEKKAREFLMKENNK